LLLTFPFLPELEEWSRNWNGTQGAYGQNAGHIVPFFRVWGVLGNTMRLKSILVGSAAASVICLAAPAFAGDYYVSVFGGINSLDGDNLAVGPFSYSTVAYSSSHGPQSHNIITGFVGTPEGGQLKILNGLAYTTFTSGFFAHTYASGFSEGSFDSGFVVGAALGMGFAENWRAELEMAWRKNNMGQGHVLHGTQSSLSGSRGTKYFTGTIYFKTSGGATTDSGIYTAGNPLTLQFYSLNSTAAPFQANVATSGDVTSFALMANLWHDFKIENSPITPFIGAGVGAVRLAVDYSGQAVLPTNTQGVLSNYGTFQHTAHFGTNTDDWTWGWQAGAGLAYDLGNGMSISAQYRYFATGDITVAGQDFGVTSNEGLIALQIPLSR